MSIVKEPARFRRIWRALSKPQYVFLLLATIFGFLMTFITPPALVGDEPNHFFRAYQLSEGVIFGSKQDGNSGGWIPKTVFETNRKLVGDIEMNHDVKFDTNLIWELRQIPLNAEDKMFVHFPNTVVYAPVSYIPQITGIYLGKVFDASALGFIYFARVVNLIFFLALAFFAIKKTPVHKWTFCFLWLTPTTIFQAASASVDAFTYGICFLTISHFLFYALDEESKVESIDIAKIFFLCLLAVLSKQAYVFLPFLFLIIPRRKFKSATVYWITFLVLTAVCFASVGIWSSLVKQIYMPYRGDIDINPDEQISFIREQPLNFLWLSATNYILRAKYYFVTFFGQLIWLDLFVPRWLIISVFITLVIIALLDKNPEIKISWVRMRSVFIGIILITAFIISVLLYMTWSPIRGNIIAGIQGRYFIPIAPLFFLLFYNRKLKWKFFDRYVHLLVYAAVIFSLIITINSIISRYYS